MTNVFKALILGTFAILFLLPVTFAGDNTWLGPTGLIGIYSADTLEAGNFALSLYFNNFDREFDAMYDDEAFSLDYTYLSLPIAYGITDRIEVSLSPHFISIRNELDEDEDGFGDVYVNLKANVVKEESNPGFGVLVFGKIATGDEEKGLGSGEMDYGAVLIGSKNFGSTGLHLNLGYRFVGDPDGIDYDDQMTYGLGLNAGLTDNLDLIGEISGETSYHDSIEDPIDLTAGVRYGLINGMVLSGGVRYALNMESDNCPLGGFVQIGFSSDRSVPPTPVAPRNPSLSCEVESKEVLLGQFTRIMVRATDPDNSPLTYSWVTTGCKLDAAETEAKFMAEGCEPGAYTVTCTVKNEKGLTASCSVTINVIKKAAEKKPTKLDLPLVPFKQGVRVDNVAKAILDDIAAQIKKYPGVKVTLVGHSDSDGSDEANKKIGLQRAENVKKYLIERHKIEADRLTVDSAGESQPIADNKTADGKKKNRRVEVLMTVEQEVK